MMQFDPSGTGRLAIADDLRAAGQERRALGGLISMDPERLGNGGRVLAGELMLSTGLHREALEILAPVDVEAEEYPAALQLRVRAAGLAKQAQAFDRSLSELARMPDVDPAPLLDVVDQLWLLEGFEEARALLETLDARMETRTPEGMLRLGMVATLAGDSIEAGEHYDRAEAYDDMGQAILGRLLLTIDDADWTRVPLVGRRAPADRLRADAARACDADAARRATRRGRRAGRTRDRGLPRRAAVAPVVGGRARDADRGHRGRSVVRAGRRRCADAALVRPTGRQPEPARGAGGSSWRSRHKTGRPGRSSAGAAWPPRPSSRHGPSTSPRTGSRSSDALPTRAVRCARRATATRPSGQPGTSSSASRDRAPGSLRPPWTWCGCGRSGARRSDTVPARRRRSPSSAPGCSRTRASSAWPSRKPRRRSRSTPSTCPRS